MSPLVPRSSSHSGRSHRLPPGVHEGPPVQVVDMALGAGGDEAHRHHRLALAVFGESALVQLVPSHQPAPAPLRVSRRGPCVLDDEPGGEDARAHRRRALCVLLVAGRREQLEALGVQDPLELRDQPGLVHPLAPQGGPVLQPRHDDRVLGQVDHRPRSPSGDQLALADDVVIHRSGPGPDPA